MHMNLSERNQQMNNRRSEFGCMSIYSRINELTIYLLLKRLQLSFQRKGFIIQWITEILYYGQGEDNFKESTRTVLYMLLFTMFFSFQRVRMGSIQGFPFMVFNSEKEVKMPDKEMEKKELDFSVCLIYAIMSTVFISEMVLSHLSSMVGSYSSSLLLMHGQTVSRENSTGLEHIRILSDLSYTRDFRMLLCMIGMMEKILHL